MCPNLMPKLFRELRHIQLVGLLLGLVAFQSFAAAPATPLTALDRYVAAPDTNYTYRLVDTIRGEGVTTYVLDMTSQSWLTTNEVNRTLWQHWVVIVKPDEVTSTKALLFIGGGGNGKTAPKKADANTALIATDTKSIVAELKMVPNQPLIFNGETKGRSEDALIAYTWDKFLRTGDEKWPARLPMTKSAVRALDTVTDFCTKLPEKPVKVDGFVIAGGSKRGWTTWTTAIVDKRVIAIAPIVIDMLNIVPSFEHHYMAYGFWAPAVGDYTAMGIMEWTGTPQYRALMKIEEPFEYRARLTMPKLLINACGDQFFLPDSSQFYWKDLPGEKYIRYVPNADHSLKNSDAWLTLLAYYHAILNQKPLPNYSWTADANGALRVQTADKLTEVRMWEATNPDARDFRLQTIGPAWTSTVLTDQGGGVYVGKVPKPEKGWTAFMVEMTYPGFGAGPIKFTTEVRVVPDVLPHKLPEKNRQAALPSTTQGN